MWKWIVGVLASLGVIAGTKRSTATAVEKPTLKIWRPLIAAILPPTLDLDFVMKWIEVESGGNPCAVGNFRQRGPDGEPREMGIAQFYNPDDLIRLKIDGHALRAYCLPETQKLARPMTREEMMQQAQGTIDLILYCRERAIRDLDGVGASWDREGRDFAALIKLQHGLPGLAKRGIPAATAYLGRPPASFIEFRETLPHIKLDPGTEKYRAAFPRIMANAIKTASAIRKANV